MVPYRLAAKAPREFPLIRNIRRNLTTIDERVEEGAIYQMLAAHLKGSEKVAWRRYGRGLGLGPGIKVMGSYRRGDVWNMFKTSQAGYDS